MTNALNRPCKEKVREWMLRRQVSAQALPAIDQIQRELGWGWKASEQISDSAEPALASPEPALRR